MKFLLCFVVGLLSVGVVAQGQRSDTADLPRSYKGPRKVRDRARPLAPGIVRHKATMSYLRKTSDNKWDVGIPLAIWHAYAKKNNIKDEEEQASLPNAAGYVKLQPEPSADIPGGGNSTERVIAVTTAAAETVSKTPGKVPLGAKSPMKSYTTPEIMLEIGDEPEPAVRYHRKTFKTEKEARAYINSIVGGDPEFGEIPKAHQSDPEEAAAEQEQEGGVENAVKLGSGSEAAKEVAAEEQKEGNAAAPPAGNADPEAPPSAGDELANADPEAPPKPEENPKDIKGWQTR